MLKKINPFIISTIILFCVCVVLIIPQFQKEKEMSFEAKMCSSITATPSWADSEGNILFSGYFENENMSINLVDTLIKDKIYFLYSPTCSWCKKQIEYFGTEWIKYEESGLTINCAITK